MKTEGMINAYDFVDSAVEGNRKLRKMGLSSISDDRIRFYATAIVYTMKKFNFHTIGEYLQACERRNETEKK